MTTEEEEIEELNRLLRAPSIVAGRRSLWKRIWWPTSYWPTRYSRTCGWWHLYWHLGAALARMRMRYLSWRGY